MGPHNRMWRLCLILASALHATHALSVPTRHARSAFSSSTPYPEGNVLILDHININHEKGRHDWLRAFYFDFLQCAVDPRKQENLQAGRRTVWANIGAQQFHLPEGKPHAQVLDGVVTLAYSDLEGLRNRYKSAKEVLRDRSFGMVEGPQDEDSTSLHVTDPWGNQFRIVVGEASERDARGKQPGEASEGLAIRDLAIYTSPDANLSGIGRFYDQVLGAPVLESTKDQVIVAVGPRQTLTFAPHPDGKSVRHEDLDYAALNESQSQNSPTPYPSNHGPHISMYVADLPGTYERVEALDALYVNLRFKRQAYTLDEAIHDCMFRCLDILDPDDIDAGPILRMEHEVRSVVTRDGSKYKSCPFDEIPQACR